MKTIIFTLTAFFSFLLYLPGFGQNEPAVGYKPNNYFDLSFGIGSSQLAGTLSWSHLHGLGQKKKFRIGYGIRYTAFTGADRNYITAPANLTSKDETIDTLFISSVSTHSVNLSIHLNFAFSKKIDAGFNIDAFGIGFGGDKTGQFISSANDGNFQEYQNASPASLNILLIGDNDRGQLNSEFYIRYWLSEKVGVRAGFSYLFSEYVTKNKLASDNDRFRNKAGLGFLAITFKPFK